MRKYSDQRECPNVRKINNKFIQYRDLKRFDAELFKQTLKQTPCDFVFVFDVIDDMLDSLTCSVNWTDMDHLPISLNAAVS